MMDPISIGDLTIKEDGPLFLISGPCVIEDEETTLRVAGFLKETSELLDLPVIFKSSYDKANRTALDSYRGPGVDKGLEVLQKVKEETEKGSPIKGFVKRKNTSPLKKSVSFSSDDYFAPARPRFLLLLHTRYFLNIGSQSA